MNRAGKLLSIFLPLVLLAGAAVAALAHGPVQARPRPAAAAAPRQCPRLPARFAGVSAAAPLTGNVAAFTAATGVRPGVVEFYTSFPYRFNSVRAGVAAQAGAVPLVQWLPFRQPLTAIAAGAEDSYIRGFAAAVKKFRCPLLLSFAHEMNGPWWPWGHRHQAPASYQAAYRHIHDVFTRAGARNAVWVWNPDRVSPAAAWWPGARYVDVVAYDGYYWQARDTFGSVFGRALREAATLAPGKRVMIAETGACPGAGMAARIRGLFRGAARSHLAGVVYFEHRGQKDWRIEGHPASEAAFRAGVRLLQGG